MLDKLTVPVRTTPAGTKAELVKVATYKYDCEIYRRLEGCIHAAFAELDTYLNQLGLMQRVATTEELERGSPGISADR
eukprot:15292086-Heterocapsa_arctica.AAC.1